MAELKRKGNYHHNGRVIHGLYADNKILFGMWQTMKDRCENPKRSNYHNYGGRGIRVCEEWHEASSFVKWALENGYKKGLQLDRIDNNGHYCPKNCHFVTPKQNNRNRRNTVLLTVNNQTKCVAEWCEEINISPYTVYWWIKRKGKEYAERRLSEIA